MTFQSEVGEWGQRTFPDSTPETIAAHLRDEAVELTEAIEAVMDATLLDDLEIRHQAVEDEAADVMLLLLHLAYRYGFDLQAVAAAKFAVNRARTWNTDSGRGYVRHDMEATR